MKSSPALSPQALHTPTVKVTIAAGAMIVLVTLLVIPLFIEVNALARDWERFNQITEKKVDGMYRLRQAIGYGGFIHHFKNFVIRREAFSHVEAKRRLVEANRILDELESQRISTLSRMHLGQIRQTLMQYQEKLAGLADQDFALLTPAQLDAKTRVSDLPAFDGLTGLTTAFNVERTAGFAVLEERLLWIARFSILGLLCIPGFVLFGWWLQRTHKKLEARSLALLEARQKADALSFEKSRFVATVSHEIRTPMNAVLGFARLGLENQPPPKLKGYLENIFASAQNLLRIVNDVLDFSKIEAGKLAIEQEVFHIESVVEGPVQAIGLYARQKGLELVVKLDPMMPPYFVGDAARIGQILLNLANNAVKFTAKGEVRIEIVLVKSEGKSATLRFSVSDTGPGLSELQMARLFQPFHQADASTARNYGGTGLGLAISRQLVETMKGQIGIESVLAQGSTFWFTLTLPIAEQPPSAGQAWPRGTYQEFESKRVLVVDDSASWREVIATYLTRMGMTVEVIASGEAALELVRYSPAERAFSILLIDWRLPGIDGVETVRRLKALGLPHAPQQIVMVSAYDLDTVKPLAEEVGVHHFLTKPVSPSRLLDLLMQQQANAQALVPARERAPIVPHSRSLMLEGKQILLVEDHPINQELAKEMLKRLGAQVDVASNGLEALRQVQEKAYDVVLMDVHMPEMDGLSATRHIRALPEVQHIPIIALTASAMSEDIALCKEAGMDEFVSKPLDPNALIQTLKKVLEKV